MTGKGLWVIGSLAAIFIVGTISNMADEQERKAAEQQAAPERLSPEEWQKLHDERKLEAEKREADRSRARAEREAKALASAMPASDLSAAFSSNPIRAASDFGDRENYVSGVVERIWEGFFGEGVLSLQGGGAFQSVVAEFDQPESLISFNKGDEALLRCMDAEGALGDGVVLSDCEQYRDRGYRR